MGGVVKAVKSVVGGIGDILEDSFDLAGKVVGSLPGLGSLGKEITRWGEDLNQVVKVVSGEYHDDMKKVQKYKDTVDEFGRRVQIATEKYNFDIETLSDRMDSLIAFDEIFHMAIANRLDAKQDKEGAEIEKLLTEYSAMRRQLENMITQLKSEYDFVIGLTEGPFLQRLIGSGLMIIGGLMSDMGDILSGDADSGTWKRLLNVAIMVIAIVIIIVMIVFSAGAASPLLYVALALVVINTFMTLDGMYSNGAATGAIMGALDFIFNDVLNLDDLIGSDFDKFDKNHEDYQDMVGYVQLALTIGAIIAAWGAGGFGTGTEGAVGAGSKGINAGTAGTYGTSMGSQQTSMLAAQDAGLVTNTVNYGNGALTIGDTLQTSSFLGMKFSTYSSLYDAYKIASNVKDFVSQNKLYEDMKNKLKEDMEKVNQVITSKTNKSMMKHYKDTAYFLQDQQEYIDRYVWSMTSQNMYVDPYGTTPVANIRFTPDKSTRGLSFGFEDLFDESTLAGSKGYFNNIIYGS